MHPQSSWDPLQKLQRVCVCQGHWPHVMLLNIALQRPMTAFMNINTRNKGREEGKYSTFQLWIILYNFIIFVGMSEIYFSVVYQIRHTHTHRHIYIAITINAQLVNSSKYVWLEKDSNCTSNFFWQMNKQGENGIK